MFVQVPNGYQNIEQHIVQAETEIIEKLSITNLISFYSEQYDISNEIPLAIANIESDYFDVFSIDESTFNEQCEGTFYEIEDNIRCGIKMIKAGEYWRWESNMSDWLYNISTSTRIEILSLCNCVTGLRSFGVNIPNGTDAKDIPINSNTPHEGGVVLFKYENDVYHAALITEMTAKYMIVRETNYDKCKETTRKVYYDDSFIIGFHSP